jgi:hypothetical protein
MYIMNRAYAFSRVRISASLTSEVIVSDYPHDDFLQHSPNGMALPFAFSFTSVVSVEIVTESKRTTLLSDWNQCLVCPHNNNYELAWIWTEDPLMRTPLSPSQEPSENDPMSRRVSSRYSMDN